MFFFYLQRVFTINDHALQKKMRVGKVDGERKKNMKKHTSR